MAGDPVVFTGFPTDPPAPDQPFCILPEDDRFQAADLVVALDDVSVAFVELVRHGVHWRPIQSMAQASWARDSTMRLKVERMRVRSPSPGPVVTPRMAMPTAAVAVVTSVSRSVSPRRSRFKVPDQEDRIEGHRAHFEDQS